MKTSLAFRSRTKTLAAAFASLLALLVVLVYVNAPVAANATIAVRYEHAVAAGRTAVGGVVKSGHHVLRNATVLVRVRDARGKVLRIVRVRTDRFGRFSTALPRGSNHVRVIIQLSSGQRSVTRVLQARPGTAVLVTAVFPPRHSGLLPGLFPY